MALAMLVSFQKQKKKKNINNAFAMLMLFEDQEHQYFACRHSLITWVYKRIDMQLKTLLHLRSILFKKQKQFFRGGIIELS